MCLRLAYSRIGRRKYTQQVCQQSGVAASCPAVGTLVSANSRLEALPYACMLLLYTELPGKHCMGTRILNPEDNCYAGSCWN